MKTKRELKRGDIFLNLWAGWKTIFVYLGTNQRVCYGFTLVEFKGKSEVQKAQYYKESLQDAERFPLIGHIDLLEMWKQNIHNGTLIGCYNRQYDETGKKIYEGTKNEKTD